MQVFGRSIVNLNSSFLALLASLLLCSYSPQASAYFYRSYTTLEQSITLEGDFENIIRHGKLRILLTQDFTSVTYLPRNRSPLADQQRMAEEFALSHGLIPELVIVKNFSELIPALVAGKGDIIINNLTINDQRRKIISFSVPVTHVREQVITRIDDDSITRVSDLNGKKVMVNRDSTFWHSLLWLKKNKYPDIEILEIPDNIQLDQLLDLLADGEIDATILDSNRVEINQGYRNDFKVAVDFSGQRDIGWGIRKDAPGLVSEINRYIQLEHMVDETDRSFVNDFDQIKKRKVLRVLLRNNATSYFLYRGELMGFEYELAREFARYHGLRLEVVVPSSLREMSNWLIEGKADIAMGFLHPGDLQPGSGIEYTRPYHYARQHVVVAKNDPAKQLSDLEHYTISARLDGGYWRALENLQQRQGVGFNLGATENTIEVEQLIQKVASGDYQATLVDEQVLDIELAKSAAVKSVFALEQEIPHALAVRAGNPLLKKELDKYIKRIYKGKFYNVLYQKYFKSKRSVQKLAQGRIADTPQGQISPFDKLVQKYADHYGFDWRLITAQMFQESGFNPKAKSFSGARGLMQLMPRTARSLGFKNVDEPVASIQAGIKYMDWLRDRFDTELPIAERLWFSLAAYNAGVGHVHDARRLAGRIGLDPDRWFENTETSILLLSQKEYSSKARYGFVNGEEPVNYVRNIKQRFEAYAELGGNLLGNSLRSLGTIVASR
jgi:membrane-bound lytic murein transglycosylase F